MRILKWKRRQSLSGFNDPLYYLKYFSMPGFYFKGVRLWLTHLSQVFLLPLLSFVHIILCGQKQHIFTLLFFLCLEFIYIVFFSSFSHIENSYGRERNWLIHKENTKKILHITPRLYFKRVWLEYSLLGIPKDWKFLVLFVYLRETDATDYIQVLFFLIACLVASMTF